MKTKTTRTTTEARVREHPDQMYSNNSRSKYRTFGTNYFAGFKPVKKR